MDIKRLLSGILMSAALLLAAGCGKPTESQKDPHESAAGIPERLTSEEEKLVRFTEGGSPDFYLADGYSNGGMFGCTWRKSSADILGGTLKMTVSQEKDGYAGAEYRTRKYSSYGFYSVSMKPARGSGLVSSFFTYTNRPVWDEIDIEFLGKDTTHVQFNYFKEGVGYHEFWYDLGFDAAEEFHEYAFEWLENSITWYVDGVAIYRATEDIPTSDTQIMMNVWNCNSEGWGGVFDPTALPATAEYEWIGFSAAE